MTTEEFNSLLQFFKVLGNESRLKILGLLANQEHSVGKLANMLGVKEPTVSHHLAMMKKLGLVNSRAEGNVRIYWLESKFLETMNRDIFSKSNLSSLVDEDDVDVWDKKVLRTFLDGERIKNLPSREKKRLVILKWLTNKIEEGVRYPEREMNELLKQYYPDYATLRRYLVDYQFMKREDGIYWRI